MSTMSCFHFAVLLVLHFFISNGESSEIEATPTVDGQQCLVYNVSCVALNSTQTTCLSTPLPYSSTSLIFATDSNNVNEMMTKLQEWSGLRHVPECWAVIQPLLCSVYMPRCYNGSVEMPSRELCQRTREPCKIVEDYYKGWPEFMKCDADHFQQGCVVSKSQSQIEIHKDFYIYK